MWEFDGPEWLVDDFPSLAFANLVFDLVSTSYVNLNE